jgi:hypothetical protein
MENVVLQGFELRTLRGWGKKRKKTFKSSTTKKVLPHVSCLNNNFGGRFLSVYNTQVLIKPIEISKRFLPATYPDASLWNRSGNIFGFPIFPSTIFCIASTQNECTKCESLTREVVARKAGGMVAPDNTT